VSFCDAGAALWLGADTVLTEASAAEVVNCISAQPVQHGRLQLSKRGCVHHVTPAQDPRRRPEQHQASLLRRSLPEQNSVGTGLLYGGKPTHITFTKL
jgi:hypothetical protein